MKSVSSKILETHPSSIKHQLIIFQRKNFHCYLSSGLSVSPYTTYFYQRFSVLIHSFDKMPRLSDLISLRPNGNAGKMTLSSSSPALISDAKAVISPVDVTAAPAAMSIPDDIHYDASSLKSDSGSDVTFNPPRNAKKETEHQRVLPVTVIAHDLILTIVNSAAPRDFMSDGFDRFVLDTCNEISAFLNEANIGLSPDTEKRSLMNEAVSFDYYRVSFDLTLFVLLHVLNHDTLISLL